jgi:hypothetical protein
MLADMLVTHHKNLSAGVPLMLGRHVTYWHVGVIMMMGCWMSACQNKGQNNRHVFVGPICCRSVTNMLHLNQLS